MSCYRIDASNNIFLKNQNMPLKALEEDASVVDGVSFMKTSLKWFDKKFTELFMADFGYKSIDNGLNTCPCLNGTTRIYCWITPKRFENKSSSPVIDLSPMWPSTAIWL